ncbi:MAG TPA: enoyl-CoA hydratase [Afifellaceae bacterium]|nr:enoyl-CoA hydratase [Afifellaceae bacterium]
MTEAMDSDTAVETRGGTAREGPLAIDRSADGVLRLTLSSPPANALSEALIASLHRALDDAAVDEAVRVVVIGAAGRIFSGGHDLKQMTARRADPDGGRAYFADIFARCSAMMQAVVALPKPVVAEVGGLATAAGCQLVASCDLAVASSEARFGVNGVDLGLFCSTPMVALSRAAQPKPALEMLMTGEMIGAERAREIGLVNCVAAPGELRAETDRLVAKLLDKPAAVLALGKKAFYEQARMGLAEAYRHTSEVIACNMAMPEAEEGIAAFLEKRKPRW